MSVSPSIALSPVVLVLTLVPPTPNVQEPTATVAAEVHRRLSEVEEPVVVWVFFSDKGPGSDAVRDRAVQDLATRFPQRTLTRRGSKRTAQGLLDSRDLPVADVYVAAVEATGADVRVESRWLNAVSATVGASQVEAISCLPFVERVQLVNRGVLASVQTAGGCFGLGGGFYGAAKSQLELSTIPDLHAAGATGEGVVIGVLDTGFVTTHAAFNQPGHEIDVVAAYDFVNDDPNVGIEPGDDPDQHFHGTIVLGMMAAYLPDQLVGASYDASYILAKTEDVTSETQVEEDFYVAGLEFCELQGADVVTSSLGYIDWYQQSQLDGLTAVTTIAVNVATSNGVVCLTAAGNNFHDEDPSTSSLIAPADAFDVITCGAMEITGEVAFFSSDGPTADGRVKPEVIAMGDQVASVWPYDDSTLSCAGGTSLSTPIVTGAVACLLEANPTWDVATVRDQLFTTADYFGAPVPDPLFVYGYGILDAAAANQPPTGCGAVATATPRADLGSRNVPNSISASPPGALPTIGNAAFAVALDDPSGTCGLTPGSLTLLFVGSAPGALPIAGLGCSPGDPGELQVTFPSAPLILGSGVVWQGTGQPAVHAASIPANPSLCGTLVPVQGVFVDVAGPSSPGSLTWALDLVLGSE